MGAGINNLVFFLCYLAVVGLGVVQAFGPTRARKLLLLVLLAAGLIFHTAYLWVRAIQADACPLSSPYDWHLLAAWLLALIALLLGLTYRRLALGLFVMPLVVVLVGAAQFADREPFAPVRASRLWGNVHGTFLLLGTVAVMIGFAAGLTYLVQAYRLKRKWLRGPHLPSLEWLERLNSRALAVSALLLAVGFASGVVLNRTKTALAGGVLSWTDPVVISSAAMLVWVVAAEFFHLIYRPARRGRKVAYLTLATFLFLAVCLTVMLFVESGHGPRKPAGEAPAASGQRPVSSMVDRPAGGAA